LPESIREWIAYNHDLNEYASSDINGVQQIDEFPAENALALRSTEHLHWLVLRQDLERPDPPVLGRWRDMDVAFDESPTVSDWTMRSALANTRGRGGSSFGQVQGDRTRLRERLFKAMPTHCRLGELELFEGRNVIVILESVGSSEKITIHAATPAPCESLPKFLLEQTRHPAYVTGMFQRPTRKRQ
jgi:hypothetical protein